MVWFKNDPLCRPMLFQRSLINDTADLIIVMDSWYIDTSIV